MTVIDLTHPISADIPVYFPWHPPTTVEQTATYAANLCVVRKLGIGTHTATHIDAPSHIFEGMPTIDQYDPSLWVREARVVDLTPREARQEITVDELRAHSLAPGMAVVLKTGWDVRFGTVDYYSTYPPLSAEAAEYLAALPVPLLAADTPFTMAVHRIMLRRGIPLVTNINNTARLKNGSIRLIAAPLLIAHGDGAPARVLAIVEDSPQSWNP
jgi:kynurenine formamidase